MVVDVAKIHIFTFFFPPVITFNSWILLRGWVLNESFEAAKRITIPSIIKIEWDRKLLWTKIQSCVLLNLKIITDIDSFCYREKVHCDDRWHCIIRISHVDNFHFHWITIMLGIVFTFEYPALGATIVLFHLMLFGWFCYQCIWIINPMHAHVWQCK